MSEKCNTLKEITVSAANRKSDIMTIAVTVAREEGKLKERRERGLTLPRLTSLVQHLLESPRLLLQRGHAHGLALGGSLCMHESIFHTPVYVCVREIV